MEGRNRAVIIMRQRNIKQTCMTPRTGRRYNWKHKDFFTNIGNFNQNLESGFSPKPISIEGI
jgi:hypothetical protein